MSTVVRTRAPILGAQELGRGRQLPLGGIAAVMAPEGGRMRLADDGARSMKLNSVNKQI